MNLLVFNIRTDVDHPTQGVTTRWLNKLSEHFYQIHVITMHKGRLDLRPNIHVHSLGGELGYSRIRKCILFYRHLFAVLARNEIHGCFTHMAVLLLLLGGPVLALKRIPRVTWYAHSVKNPVMMGALLWSHMIITASQDSFPIESKKVCVTGHGIDTDHYSRRDTTPNKIFTIGSVGRISRIKNYETLLRAARLLIDEGMDSFQIKLYGNIQTRDDRSYMDYLRRLIETLKLEDNVVFPGPLSGEQVPGIVSTFDIFINLLSRGGAGKAVLEAMSMEVPTLICTPAFNRSLSETDREMLVFQPDNLADQVALL